MTDYYIFRHGDTKDSGSLFVRIIGHLENTFTLPILSKGIPALEKIGNFLKDVPTDANFCSPYLRCVDSAKIVGTVAKKRFQSDERIAELEDGEPFSSFYTRVNNFLNEIDKKNYSAISICTHGAVIAAIKHLKTSGKFFFFQVLDYPKPGNLIIIKNKKIEDVDFNQRS
ncbi:MAG: histidine phosphatase family protein [Candidatus Microgenomates bacterium]|jgi:broad specificity phosphatase PhoE